MTIFQMLFSGKGRIRRRDYWLWSLALVVLITVAEFAGHYVIVGPTPAAIFLKDLAGWATLKVTPYNAYLWVVRAVAGFFGVCISAKRWHDRNRSGYLSGLIYVLSLAAIIVQGQSGPASGHLNWIVFYGCSSVSLLLGLWAFIELGCLDGTKGSNRYGPSPKGIGDHAEVF